MSCSSKVSITLLSILLTMSFAGKSVARDEEKVLNIYNWTDYIAPDTIANFEKETGIKVRYDGVAVDNAEIDAKLRSKRDEYDIVVSSSDWAKTQIEDGLLQKLDKSKLDNYKNYDPDFLLRLSKADPGNLYLAGWAWGYTTIGINVDKVLKVLGTTPVPKNLWELVFNPTYTSKLKSCGIMYLDSSTDIMPIALNYIGKPAYSNNAEDYTAAFNMLKKVRADVRTITSDGQADKMTDNSTCVAIGWGADFSRARASSLKKGNYQNIAPSFPEKGALLFMDSMAIPKSAKHPNNAHLFINYILRPQVHAGITNATKYAIPNKAALQFVNKEIKSDRAYFLDKNEFNRLTTPETLNKTIFKVRNDTFEKFKVGS